MDKMKPIKFPRNKRLSVHDSAMISKLQKKHLKAQPSTGSRFTSSLMDYSAPLSILINIFSGNKFTN